MQFLQFRVRRACIRLGSKATRELRQILRSLRCLHRVAILTLLPALNMDTPAAEQLPEMIGQPPHAATRPE